MSYLTIEQLEERFTAGEILSVARASNGTDVDDNRVQDAIDDASNEADSYLLGGGYALPLTSTPAILARIVADLARERLYKNRPTDAVTDAAARARADLKLIAQGVIKMPVETGSDPITATAADAPAFDVPMAAFNPWALADYAGWRW